MPMDMEEFRKVLAEKEAEAQAQIKLESPTLYDQLPILLAELEEDEKTKKPTTAFFLPVIRQKHLYTIIAPSNAGKTWWSLSTAIGLAREGRKVYYISTEDSDIEIADYLRDMYQATEDKEFLKNIRFQFMTSATPDALRNLLKEIKEAETEVLIIDYFRPDFVDKNTDSLYAIVSAYAEVLRDFLAREGNNFSIIQTIQANPEMYRTDILQQIMDNPMKLATMIDGGNTSFRRSQVVAIIYNHEGTKQRYIVPIKAKHRDFAVRNSLVSYSIDTKNFAIQYERDEVDNSLYYQLASKVLKETSPAFTATKHKKV